MPLDALRSPTTDATPIFEFARSSYGTHLLTAGVCHLRVFEHLSAPIRAEDLRARLGLAERPFVVLLTALRAFGLIATIGHDRLLVPTPLAAEHLLPGAPYDITGYLGLSADDAGVRKMVDLLRTNRPTSVKADEGAAYIFREGLDSAMAQETSARRLTEALAGRAKVVAPALARALELSSARTLLDLGGGSGIYSIALLQQNPHLRAIVFDSAAVLKTAAEYATAYGTAERLTCVAGDMFADPLPKDVDTILLSNVLHDWDVPECVTLLCRCAEILPIGGRVLIHDVFLNDERDGPLPTALYSAALFTLTEGRAYSAAEYRRMLTTAGLTPSESIQRTAVHCGVLSAVKG